MLTAERLREILHYDPATGVFTWLAPVGNRACGAPAGRLSHGYIGIQIGGKRYLAHRLAWLYVTGEWPSDQVDHINLDRSDNRWCNLRPAGQSQNMGNTRVYCNNTSGFKGVSWEKGRRKWDARVLVKGKNIHLGYFDAPHLAYAAYCLAARKYFGDFARVYEADQLIIPRKVFERRVLLNLLAATQFERAA
jgi:hypothetical protein